MLQGDGDWYSESDARAECQRFHCNLCGLPGPWLCHLSTAAGCPSKCACTVLCSFHQQGPIHPDRGPHQGRCTSDLHPGLQAFVMLSIFEGLHTIAVQTNTGEALLYSLALKHCHLPCLYHLLPFSSSVLVRFKDWSVNPLPAPSLFLSIISPSVVEQFPGSKLQLNVSACCSLTVSTWHWQQLWG